MNTLVRALSLVLGASTMYAAACTILNVVGIVKRWTRTVNGGPAHAAIGNTVSRHANRRVVRSMKSRIPGANDDIRFHSDAYSKFVALKM
jgi:hypothetical protein